MNPVVYLINHVYLRPLIKYVLYELCKDKKLLLSYLRVFGNKYYILHDQEYLSKFDSKGF